MLPSRLGLGTSRIGSFNNSASLADSERLVRKAIDLGLRVIDTASIYGQGDSERVVGRAIAGQRDEVFLITKGARRFSAKYRLLRPLKPVIRSLLKGRQPVTQRRDSALVADWSPARITASLDASLRRLRTGSVDLYLLHSPPPEVAADPAVAAALTELRLGGKARKTGVSCDDMATLEAALTQDSVGAVELPWTLIATLGPLREMLHSRGIIVLAREVISQQAALPPGQALQRSLADPAIDCTLVGTTRLGHLEHAARLAQGVGA